MKAFRQPDFAERRESADAAKKAQLERARAKLPANDPDFLAKQAARAAQKAIGDAARQARAEQRRLEQETRDAERAAIAERERQEREAALALEQQEREAAIALEAARAARRQEEGKQLVEAQKAIRDARYAARKARKG